MAENRPQTATIYDQVHGGVTGKLVCFTVKTGNSLETGEAAGQARVLERKRNGGGKHDAGALNNAIFAESSAAYGQAQEPARDLRSNPWLLR